MKQGKRIVIFPFDNLTGQATQTKKNWTAARRSKLDKIRDIETGKIPAGFEPYKFFHLGQLEELKLAIAGCAGPEDQIYVCGHCAPGVDLIAKDVGGKVGLKSAELAYIFAKTLLLTEAFAGTIKIYACFSGVPDADNKSFAARFKNIMGRAKYKNCQVIGYSMNLSDYLGEHKMAYQDDHPKAKVAGSMMAKFEAGELSQSEIDALNYPRSKSAQVPI
ncbi:hypothetical protein [Pseudomonas nunensis]|uniref:Uncharacterized protein n=1 Tax=Pseudomonas nunensis TaxID=2961896 RepID=A0ABY5ERZ8_9PSED|nr:hypothetical protein [Pseudomonas nunensis]KPN91310.1 hypothetical protein AL066_13515 [Pseudomonas nunensis]MCL5230032.1 hypothetical protein [Pseudomonas nunensis]UTO17580.1 hypothetical protein NK667_14875 [Pseudomonas nunensis]